MTLPPTCMAFAIHPDRRVVIVTADNVTITLTPGADGLYGITGLIEDVDPTQVVVSGLSGPAGAGNRRFEWPHLRLSGQVLSGLGGPT